MSLIAVLAKHFPDIHVHCVGEEIYENLVLESGGPMPSKETLLGLLLQDSKSKKIAELSQNCQDDIVSGFISAALGVNHFYDSDELDQVNLIGAVTATSPSSASPEGDVIAYATRAIVEGVTQPKMYVTHSHAQLRHVLGDGANVKLAKLQNFNDKRDYINNNVLTLEQIEAVTWTSNP